MLSTKYSMILQMSLADENDVSKSTLRLPLSNRIKLTNLFAEVCIRDF